VTAGIYSVTLTGAIKNSGGGAEALEEIPIRIPPRLVPGLPRNEPMPTEPANMPRCIYCQQERPPEFYAKVEHVLPQSFGRFLNNLTLRDVVCDLCNQYFGDHLEIFLGRDTYEGQMRFLHGVKDVEDFKSMGRNSRLIVRCAEGQFTGCYMMRYYSEEKNDIAVKPLPQVGFMMSMPEGYRYFLLNQIPTQAELDGLGYQPTHPRPVVGLEVDPDELTGLLAEKGIAFRHQGSLAPDAFLDTIGCDLEVLIDDVTFRSVAKIAFNYLAYWEGASFVQHPAFDKARRYIRWGHAPGYELIRVAQASVLGDEPEEGQRRLGHLITVSWATDGVSVFSQVALFNWMTYQVSLAHDFTGPPPELTRGHFFNVANHQIFELGSRRSLPVKALEHNIIFEFEKLATQNGHDLREAVDKKLISGEIEYQIDTNLPRGPYFDHVSRTICVQDSYLAFLWAYVYSQFVIYEVGVQLPLTQGRNTGVIEFDTELLRRAKQLECWALSFAETYTAWDESVLPNPRSPTEGGSEEKAYIEKANAVFLKAVVFLLFHEYAHAIFDHVPNETDSYLLEQEKEADNFALDQVVFTCTTEKDKQIAGLSLVLLCTSSLFLVKEARSIWQRRHPDLHERIRHAISELNLQSEESKYYLYNLACIRLKAFLDRHGHPMGQLVDETAEDLFFRYLHIIDGIEASTE
jgi:hypothetical protein